MNSPIKNLVKRPVSKVTLAVIAALSFSSAPSALAQEELEVKKVERIAVTGSRIKRIEMEAASPVVSIDAAAIAASGFSTVSDVLRNTSLNSFGSWGGGSNNGWSSQATVRLKGQDSRQTLVLIDGIRMAKSPVTGGASNLNLIPATAVERIDIMSDGGSAVYGSDAVAGVVNVILKKEFTGLEVSAKQEYPDIDAADSQRYTFTGGIDGEKGSMVFSWEHYERDELLMADLDYAKAQLKEPGLDPAYIDNWHGISSTGRVIEQSSNGWSTQALNTENNCNAYNNGLGEGAFIGPLLRLRDSNAVVCGYDYTAVAQEQPESRRDSFMARYNYEITDDINLFARGLWMNQTTTDVSAGVPAWFPINDALPERVITTEAGETLTLAAVDAGGWFGYRMNTLGERTAEHSDTNLDFVVGLEGGGDWFTWDVHANYNRYENFVWGVNYTSTPALSGAVGSLDADGEWSGWDPRDPDSLPPEDVKANFDKRRYTEQRALRGGLQLDLFELDGGMLSTYVGASFTKEEYSSFIDAQASAGNTGGGNGGSGGEGSRSINAVFAEVYIPLIEDLDINVAARYDDYSDFGGTFNPQMNLTYRPIDSLMLRASAGTGFQAPLLTDLYRDRARGYRDNEINFIECYRSGIALEDCNISDEYWGTSGGNPDLEPEESENFNVGAVWQFTEGWSATFDFWTLDVENRIVDIAPEVIQLMQIRLWQEFGDSTDISSRLPGVSIIYRGGNNIDEIISPIANAGLRESAGWELGIQGKTDIGFGELEVDLHWSHMQKFRTSFINSDGETILGEDELGEIDRPQDRVNTSLTWRYDEHSVNLYSYWIASQEDTITNANGETEVVDSLDSFTAHNLTYTYQTPWEGKVSVGVTNLFDEDTPRTTLRPREPYSTLFDIRGRVYSVSYSQRF